MVFGSDCIETIYKPLPLFFLFLSCTGFVAKRDFFNCFVTKYSTRERHCVNLKFKGREHTELNHGPIGLQPIALPLSYTPSCSAWIQLGIMRARVPN